MSIKVFNIDRKTEYVCLMTISNQEWNVKMLSLLVNAKRITLNIHCPFQADMQEKQTTIECFLPGKYHQQNMPIIYKKDILKKYHHVWFLTVYTLIECCLSGTNGCLNTILRIQPTHLHTIGYQVPFW